MRTRRRQLRLLASAALLGPVLLVLVGGAFSAGRTQTWRWQTATSNMSRELIATTSASGSVALAASIDPAGDATLVVRANGREAQRVSAASLPNDEPLAAFLIGEAAGSVAIVGVVRSDVAHVLLRADGALLRELPLNSAGAFAASDAATADSIQLEALAPDGSTLGRIDLPTTKPVCGTAPATCSSEQGPPNLAPVSPVVTVASRKVLGNSWRLQTYTNAAGDVCIRLRMGRGGTSSGCHTATGTPNYHPTWGAAGHSTVSGRAGWGRLWLFGQAPPTATRVTLVRECAIGQVEFDTGAHRGWYLLVLTPQELHAGGLPRELNARDVSGKVIQDTHISIGPPNGRLHPGERSCGSRVTQASSTSRAGANNSEPRAFARPQRGTDALPYTIHVPDPRGAGATEKVIATRRIASYTDGRGRRALLYLLKTQHQICDFIFWGSGAGGGCNSSTNFFANGHLMVGSGHHLSGVADDDVRSLVVVGSRGVRHPVPLSDDGGFIYDCKAYNGCICVVDHVEAFDSAGRKIESDAVGGHCRKPQSASRATGNASSKAQAAAARGYTISNRGQAVPARGNRNLFQGHSYQLFLLGSAAGRAFYRVQVTQHFTCWASGPSQTIGKIGGSGCPALVGAYPLQLDDTVIELRRGERVPRYIRVNGIVADQAASVALQDSTGATVKSVPVTNNLFSIPPPYPHISLRVVPLDAQGKPLPPHPDWGEHQTPPPNLFGPRATKVAPASLGTVVQKGEAKGITVSADQEGVVVFDARSIDAATRRALGGRVAWFSCFQINGQNVRQNRSAGISTPLAPLVAFKLTFKPHYDGCEAGGSYGHRWHDQYGAHSTLEIPFTAQGTRYFEDRATARDLSAFVRSAKTQTIRRKTGAQLQRAIRDAYGSEISFLSSASARAVPGKVGVWTHNARTIFSEQSHLGDRFYVEFFNGKLIRQNVRGLAFVF